MEHLLSVADAGLMFSCGQSTFMQCYSVALNKHLINATVHAGKSEKITFKLISIYLVSRTPENYNI